MDQVERRDHVVEQLLFAFVYRPTNIEIELMREFVLLFVIDVSSSFLLILYWMNRVFLAK